jgi:hypothetical protein
MLVMHLKEKVVVPLRDAVQAVINAGLAVTREGKTSWIKFADAPTMLAIIVWYVIFKSNLVFFNPVMYQKGT